MTKKLNEASAKLDLSGLETSELTLLSEILRLAGQAEAHTMGMAAAASPEIDPTGPLEMAPMRFDEPEVDVISSPMLDPEAHVEASVPLGDDEPYDSSGFDVDELLSLSGIHESASECCADEIEDQNEVIEENQLLPDMFLDEAPEELFGPFSSEQLAVLDGEQKTNGLENEHFIITVKGNKFFWKRMVQEDIENRPEPEQYNADGIIHSKHNIEDKKISRGDNHLLFPLKENDLCGAESLEGRNEESDSDEPEDEPTDLDESTESIFESINSRFNKFMGE